MKQLKTAALVLLAGMAAAACSDDETFAPTRYEEGSLGAFVINQGNMGVVDGSVDAINFTDGTYASSVFAAANGQSLGDTPQDGVAYGSRLYIAVYGSDVVWAVDRTTMKIEARIPTNDPEGICAAGGCVYVSNNDGYLSRIDTTTLSVTGRIAVGPNPVRIAAANGFLYVAISDGYNYNGGYADGKRVAKVDMASFTKVKDIAVGLNPGPVTADAAGNVFVVCLGDYGATPSLVQKISPDDQVTDIGPGTSIAARGTTLYVLDNVTDWSTTPATTVTTYKTYDTQTGRVTNEAFIAGEGELPPAPVDIDVNPANGDLYVCSQPSVTGYTLPGYVYRYDTAGRLVKRYDAGVHPCAVVFN